MKELIRRRRENIRELAEKFYSFRNTYYGIKSEDYIFASNRIERYLRLIEEELIDLVKFIDYQQALAEREGENQ
jgi:hypothetical protein